MFIPPLKHTVPIGCARHRGESAMGLPLGTRGRDLGTGDEVCTSEDVCVFLFKIRTSANSTVSQKDLISSFLCQIKSQMGLHARRIAVMFV